MVKQKSIESILAALNQTGVRYLIAGGLAVVAHGVVRFTADMDLILDMEQENLSRAVTVFASLGYRPRAPVPLSDFADEEIRKTWISEKGLTVFSLWSPSDPMTEIDLFVECPLDDFERAYSKALVLEPSPGIAASFVGLDDLLMLKARAARPQDLADIDKLKQLRHSSDG
jgi:hypothetical protein